MRWVIRIGVICICLLLWNGIFGAAPDIEKSTNEVLMHKPFPFPCMLPDSQIYVWGLTSGSDSSQKGTALLLVQNVGSTQLQDVQFVFLADDKELQFALDVLSPGSRVYIGEASETAYEDWNTVSYVSHTVKPD